MTFGSWLEAGGGGADPTTATVTTVAAGTTTTPDREQQQLQTLVTNAVEAAIATAASLDARLIADRTRTNSRWVLFCQYL